MYKSTYEEKIHSYEDNLYSQMKIASLQKKSIIFDISFIQISKNKKLYSLLNNTKELYSYFEIPKSNRYIKVNYLLKYYKNDIKLIEDEIIGDATRDMIIILFVSLIFFILYYLSSKTIFIFNT